MFPANPRGAFFGCVQRKRPQTPERKAALAVIRRKICHISAQKGTQCGHPLAVCLDALSSVRWLRRHCVGNNPTAGRRGCCPLQSADGTFRQPSQQPKLTARKRPRSEIRGFGGLHVYPSGIRSPEKQPTRVTTHPLVRIAPKAPFSLESEGFLFGKHKKKSLRNPVEEEFKQKRHKVRHNETLPTRH